MTRTTTPTSSTTTPPSTVPAPVTGKLRTGQLRQIVAAHLAATPGEHTPGTVARALGRSAGAVANALATLAARGEAELACEKPVRYRATETTASAAASTPTPAPGGPARGGRTRTRASGTPTAPEAPSGAAAPAEGASPAAPAPETPVTGPVPRPNGQHYRPRLLADLPDVNALRRLRAAGIPALLYGPPGTGKTALIEAAFPDLVTLAGDGDTAVGDFVGEYTQTPAGGYEFVYGPLVTAMTEGRALLIDDATLISPKVLAVVYPAMDGRRTIQVKAHRGETVTAAEGFYVVAGHNPGVHGAVLTEALASRFAAQIHVATDYDLATTLKIDSRAVRVARNLATRAAKGEIGWAPQLRELLAFERLSRALGAEAAVANLVGIAPEEDRDVVAEIVARVYGRPFAPLSLGRQI